MIQSVAASIPDHGSETQPCAEADAWHCARMRTEAESRTRIADMMSGKPAAGPVRGNARLGTYKEKMLWTI